MHGCRLGPGADHNFAPGFHYAARGAEALPMKLRVLHASSIVPDLSNAIARLHACIVVQGGAMPAPRQPGAPSSSSS